MPSRDTAFDAGHCNGVLTECAQLAASWLVGHPDEAEALAAGLQTVSTAASCVKCNVKYTALSLAVVRAAASMLLGSCVGGTHSVLFHFLLAHIFAHASGVTRLPESGSWYSAFNLAPAAIRSCDQRQQQHGAARM